MVPSSTTTQFLTDHRAFFISKIGGIVRFPMRALGRSDSASQQHEEHVRHRFETGGSNLFGLSINPLQYLGHPTYGDDEFLYRLFILGENMALPKACAIFGKSFIESARQSGFLLTPSSDLIRCPFRLVPCGDQLFLSESYCSESDMVYLSNDSLFLSRFVRDEVEFKPDISNVLDLGTGTGLLACLAAEPLGVPATGIDINPRAIAFAEANARINGVKSDWHVKAYHEASILDGSFVVANPPFVFMPQANDTAMHSDGGTFGLDLTLEVLEILNKKLPRNGQFVVMTQSVTLVGDAEPKLLQRLRGKLPHLDMRVQNVGTMPILPKYADFYHEQGVGGLNQLIITGEVGDGDVHYEPINRFHPEMCFG